MTSPKNTPQVIENKFKLGQLVRTNWKKSKNVKFRIDKIQSNDSSAIYAGDGMGFFSESELEGVKEPLRAEFEGVVWCCQSIARLGNIYYLGDADGNSLITEKFHRKKVKAVIIEELLEGET